MNTADLTAAFERHRATLLAVLFGGLAYAGILSFPGRTIAHNREIADLVVIAAIALTVWLFQRGTRIRFSLPTVLLLLAAAVVVTLSMWQAINPVAAQARLKLYLACAALGILASAAAAGVARATLRRSLVAICLVHLACLTAFLLAVATREPGVVLEREYVPDFSNVRHFGYLSFLAASAGTALAVLAPRWRLAGAALSAIGLFGVFLLGSRGAFVAWLLVAILLTVFIGRERRAFALLALAAVLAAQALVYGFRFVQAENSTRPLGLAERFVVTDTAFTGSGRGPVWRQSLAAISERPWLGYGPEGYKTSKCCDKRFVHPHNAVLQVALEFGLVGVALAGALLATILLPALRALWTGLRAGRSQPELAALCALMLGLLAFSMVDGLLYHAIPLVHFAWLCALLPGVTRESGAAAEAASAGLR